MFAKLMFIITVVGATACALLVIRQQRIDTFHEISQAHQRLLEHERVLWQLRSEIASRCRPQQVRLVMNELGGGWVPLPARESNFNPADARYVASTVSTRTPESETQATPPTAPPKPKPAAKPTSGSKKKTTPAAGKKSTPRNRAARE